MKTESEAVIAAIEQTLKNGFRTRDIADSSTAANLILGTDAMGDVVLGRL
jgi:3-isopropylmalate dehydrogenase